MIYAGFLNFRYSTLEGGFLNWKRLGDGFEYASPIRYNQEYRQVEKEREAMNNEDGVEVTRDDKDSRSTGKLIQFTSLLNKAMTIKCNYFSSFLNFSRIRRRRRKKRKNRKGRRRNR